MLAFKRFYKATEDFRDGFSRDRDRVIHCSSFRRLEYKTQVFINHEGDYFRTRLTHSLEVSQIARTLCRELGLHGKYQTEIYTHPKYISPLLTVKKIGRLD